MKSSIHDIEVQDRILQEMIRCTQHHGWSLKALEQAVITLGFPEEDGRRAFQGELNRAFSHLMEMIDRQMLEKLKAVDLTIMRIRERIIFLITLRLELLNPYRALLIKGLKKQVYSLNFSPTIPKFFSTVNEMWYRAGDQATDFNYYTKRFLLSSVYGATFLFWLRDQSPEFSKTHEFLAHRIDQVMKLSGWLHRFKNKN